MALLARVFVLMLLVGCGLPPSAPIDPPHVTQQTKLPEFVNEPDYNNNASIVAPTQQLILFRNLDAIKEIVKHDSATVHDEMLRRLSPGQPMSLRLIAAAVLMLKNDEEGRKFFLTQSKVPQDLGDLYVTFTFFASTTDDWPKPSPDLSWAEDFLIEALQNRTRIPLREALDLPGDYRMGDVIEIRELAVEYGDFSDHLLRMHSEKALPVVLSLLHESPFHGLKTAIGYLGAYKDQRVEALLLEVLTDYQNSKSEDTYRFAVSAATQMGLKAAVPILLQHLDDRDSYEGLIALGDASIVPTIRAALPHLTSYAKAEAELAIVHLQSGDKLPLLLQLLKREDYLLRDDVVWALKELRDPRSVSAMTSTLCYDRDSYVRSTSIRVLAEVGNREAIRGLINGLGCDYSKLKRFKTSDEYDYNTQYRVDIAMALQDVTGQNFGTDQKRWTLWLDQEKPF
jgi:HEAT repeat protein